MQRDKHNSSNYGQNLLGAEDARRRSLVYRFARMNDLVGNLRGVSRELSDIQGRLHGRLFPGSSILSVVALKLYRSSGMRRVKVASLNLVRGVENI